MISGVMFVKAATDSGSIKSQELCATYTIVDQMKVVHLVRDVLNLAHGCILIQNLTIIGYNLCTRYSDAPINVLFLENKS